MRKITAIFFVLLYVVAMLRPVQPYLEYVLNQDYIAEFLCINKDKPKLKCHGKCHLAKALEKQQENEPQTLRVSLKNYPIGFVNILQIKPFQDFIASVKGRNFLYQNLYYFDYKYCDFHPPDVT